MNNINTSRNFPISPVIEEEFRSLFSSLEFSGANNRIICITSSFPNEGKSYVAYHLARTIAESGQRVALLDADLRNSSLYKELGFKKDMIGLSHVLAKKASTSEAIYATSTNNLFIIPTGAFSSNPTILFRSNLFKELLASLRKVMDYVIIDTPPIGMVTDSSIIANASDASLMVVGAGMEHIKIAKESIETLKGANENFLGVIINKMTADKSGYGSYGKYGKYGKYGQYGSYGKRGKK